MNRLKVVLFGEVTGSGLAESERILSSGGYRCGQAKDSAQFRANLSSAHCALVYAYHLSESLLVNPFDDAHVPPVVLISPLPTPDATRELHDQRVVHEVLQPAPLRPLLLRVVTRAVIADVLRRLADAAERYPGLARPLRSAMREPVKPKKRRVKSLARSSRIVPRTLEVHWAKAFGPDSAKLKDFCRGVSFLEVISIALIEPQPVWSRIWEDLGIARSTFREASQFFAGRPPSDLDLTGRPGVLIARVCERAMPPSLRAWVLGGEET